MCVWGGEHETRGAFGTPFRQKRRAYRPCARPSIFLFLNSLACLLERSFLGVMMMTVVSFLHTILMLPMLLKELYLVCIFAHLVGNQTLL